MARIIVSLDVKKSQNNLFSNEDGQTVVEYILMISVMMTIIVSSLSLVKNRMGDITKCDRPPNDKTLLCKINKVFTGEGNKKFQYYRFK